MDLPVPDLIDKLKGLVGGVQKGEERKDPGPGDVQPTGMDTRNGQQLVTMTMTEDEVKEWWGRVNRARQRVKNREEAWDTLLKAYLPVVKAVGTPETIRVMGHFRNVHTKMGQLFYRSPDLVLTPKDPGPAQDQMPNPQQAMMPPGSQPLPPLTREDIIAVKQAVLKDKLGRDGIKASRLMDELLFDVLAWAGVGWCKIGYSCVMKNVDEPVMGPDPTAIVDPMNPQPPPMVQQIGPDGQPLTQVTPITIWEQWYCRRFSPKKGLFNDDLHSTRYDEDATWMGMEFFMSPNRAKKKFNLTDDQVMKATEDDRLYKHEGDEGTKAPGLVRGVEIYLKAAYFTDEIHPEVLYQLVLLDGLEDAPVVYRLSPDQTIDEKGRLTPDSMIGFPFLVLVCRDLADSPFPPSDAAFTNGGIKELSTWRRQSILIRDAAIGKYFYDMGAFDEPEIELLKNGEIGCFVGVRDGMLANGADRIFTTTRQVQMSADDYRGQEIIKQDIDETLGISSWSAGAPQDTVRTATEVASVQTSVAGRNDKELNRVVDFYLDLARKLDTLLMRYATEAEYVEITGVEGAKRIQMWNGSLVSGRYLYDVAPDSMLRVDTAKDFELDARFYNLAAPDPLFNREYWLRRLARRRGADPSKVIYSAAMMMAQGPQAPHGGQTTDGTTVNQHEQSRSGKRENEPGAENARDKENMV